MNDSSGPSQQSLVSNSPAIPFPTLNACLVLERRFEKCSAGGNPLLGTTTVRS